jgi:hypothetical protein
MTVATTEISLRGRWIRVPSIDVSSKTIAVTGNRLKIARISDEEWLDSDVQDPEFCIQRLREARSHGLRADIFTFTQQLPETSPRYQFHTEQDRIAALRITSFNHWWEKLPQEGRKNVRRAEKRGVVMSVRPLDDDLIRGIVGVNNDTPMRQGIPYIHYGKTFEQVQKDRASFPGRSEYICAHLGTELIGFAKIVYRAASASIIQFLPKQSHADKRPANALLAEIVKRCAERGVPWLVYGMLEYGNKSDSSLAEFKMRNGFEEVLMPRYYVPLTIWGKICMSAGAQRGKIGMLPPKVIAIVVGARSKYYQFKQKGRCSLMAEQPKSNRQMGCSNPPAGSSLE